MVFSDLYFIYIFLPLLMLCYYINKSSRHRQSVLVAFSLFFYAWGEPVCVFVMIGLVLIDYFMGILIVTASSTMEKRIWLTLAIIVNLGVLGLFKYLGFFENTLNTLFRLNIPVIGITMPIGISFFTFQTMSYVIDVYRGDTEVQKSYWKLLLYVSFFPQLIAGPIVRYKDIEAQIDNRHVSPKKFNDGLARFARGMAKKVLIADACSAALESLINLNEVTFIGRWVAAVFFTLQLYFDFSGYSDMAIGLGKMFGFEFLENFDYPLVSTSATEFWRRWHMSLGTFFRDYVYIPLGGNRHSQWRNILVVWFLTGLWHGASWNFVLWGLYYAALLVLEKTVLLKKFKALKGIKKPLITHAYTIFITVFGFTIFYFTENTFKNIGYLFGIGCKAFTNIYTNSIIADNIILLIAAIIFACPVLKVIDNIMNRELAYGFNRVIKTILVIVILILATIKLAGATYSPFLYFRF